MAKKNRTPAQKAADARRTGRPPLKPKDRRTTRVSAFFTKAEVAWLTRQAHKAGKELAVFIRDRVLEG